MAQKKSSDTERSRRSRIVTTTAIVGVLCFVFLSFISESKSFLVAEIAVAIASGLLAVQIALSLRARYTPGFPWQLVLVSAASAFGMPALVSIVLPSVLHAETGMPLLLFLFWSSVGVSAHRIIERYAGRPDQWASPKFLTALVGAVGVGGLVLFITQYGAIAEPVPAAIHTTFATDGVPRPIPGNWYLQVRIDGEEPLLLQPEDGQYNYLEPIYFVSVAYRPMPGGEVQPEWIDPYLPPDAMYRRVMKAIVSFGLLPDEGGLVRLTVAFSPSRE